MMRFARSLILGLVLGTMAGLYFGWIHFPPESRSSKLADLAQRHRDDYTVMVAAGYAAHGDVDGAIERLQRLEIGAVSDYLRGATERIIRTSARSLDDIRLLVRLARELGQLTPAMTPFLDARGGDP